MSEKDKKSSKREAEESVLEKIYKKIKKLEDHCYNLKKTSTNEQNGGSSSVQPSTSRSTEEISGTDEQSSSADSAKLNEIMQLLEKSDGPNNESDKEKQVVSALTTPESEESSIDEEALRILGEDPSLSAPKNFILQSNLASLWKTWITAGLEKDTRISLLKEYSREGNCPLEAPILNPELVASLNETATKRDNHFVDSQHLVGSAMSALGSAITLLLNDKGEGVDRNELLKLLCDSGKLMAQLHHKESLARKAYILPGLDKKAKTILGKTQTDKYLFGADLAEKLKSAKAVEKAGLELKLQPASPTPRKTPLKTNQVNWKSPSVTFRKPYQAGNNQRGSLTFKQPRGYVQQENWKPSTTQQNPKGQEKPAKKK